MTPTPSPEIESVARSPFSGEATARVWGRKDGRAIFACPTTGAVFFDRAQIRSESYQDYYSYLSGFDERRFAWEFRIRRRKYVRQLALMARYTTGRRLLDIGAGPGYFVKVAADHAWHAEGVEISQEAVRYGRRLFEARYVALDDVEDAGCDVVTCHHVLEHLIEPAPFLDLLWRKLAPGGLLVVHVPHQQPLSFRVRNGIRRLVTDDRGDMWCSLYGDEHISGFTKRSLRQFVERHRFATLFTRSVGMWSKFSDPFFLGNFIRDRTWGLMVRKATRHAIEGVGIPFGQGDLVVGYFRKQEICCKSETQPDPV